MCSQSIVMVSGTTFLMFPIVSEPGIVGHYFWQFLFIDIGIVWVGLLWVLFQHLQKALVFAPAPFVDLEQ